VKRFGFLSHRRSNIRFSICSAISFCLLGLSFGYLTACGRQVSHSSEREAVLSALIQSYGKSIDATKPVFEISSDFVLAPQFSADSLFIKISIEPKDGLGIYRGAQLSKSEFDVVLAKISSIKALGNLQEDSRFGIMHGGRVSSTKQYENAFFEIDELGSYRAPRPVASAHVFYMHPVTVVVDLLRSSRPQSTGSSACLCVHGESYVASRAEILKAWSKPYQQQTLTLAGPTQGSCLM